MTNGIPPVDQKAGRRTDPGRPEKCHKKEGLDQIQYSMDRGNLPPFFGLQQRGRRPGGQNPISPVRNLAKSAKDGYNSSVRHDSCVMRQNRIQMLPEETDAEGI